MLALEDDGRGSVVGLAVRVFVLKTVEDKLVEGRVGEGWEVVEGAERHVGVKVGPVGVVRGLRDREQGQVCDEVSGRKGGEARRRGR